MSTMSSPTPSSVTICIDSDDESAPIGNNLEFVCSILLPVLEVPSSVPLKVFRDNSLGQRVGRHPALFCISYAAGGILRLQAHGDLSGTLISLCEKDIQGIHVAKDGLAKISLRTAVEAGVLYEESVSILSLLPKHGVTAAKMYCSLRSWLPTVSVTVEDIASEAQVSKPDWRSIVLKWDGIELSARDSELLGEERCLNDSVIEFCLKLVMQVVAPQELRDKMLVTSTFFYQKLTSNGVGSGEEGWHNVRKWHSHIPGGVLSQEYIVVPINEGNLHWFLVVICFPALAFPDHELALLSGHKPRIVCLDSGQEVTPKGETLDFLRGFLWREWCDRRSQDSAESWPKCQERFSQMEAVRAEVPQQQNGTDCGIFIILYLLALCRSETSRFGIGLAPHNHWFGSREISECRKQLTLILGLLKRAALKTGETCVGRLLKHDEELLRSVRQAFERTSRSQDDTFGSAIGNSEARRPPKRQAAAEALQKLRKQRSK
mmetsp:Transcript_87042/g.191226  ORF Transcript_87042/g.191226 Transcript_87042/m.191226 type:complete len:490 (+) Transcript_87042:115-1584(+)|eukprot:CAMPEP_0206461922 /NCGR_PEP_ID=MMETSP0324_2-20121206/25658_1 /ASSEMBLY_ACC=CAM_ASM_000836 /TAXON_ID=2866 /ORGANISM="Crypthecodinium cohnii, Strain Seligo" /LENGTH=489 /DNA_ID=CAMNT_0053933953 /DNA_START=35 /DNA_END=1504 /DNA_ORIENTATION=+